MMAVNQRAKYQPASAASRMAAFHLVGVALLRLLGVPCHASASAALSAYKNFDSLH